MRLELHANATTTPKVRAEIQASTEPVRLLAARYGVSERTIRRWRARGDVHDRSHRRHHQTLSMTAEEEALICALRRDLGLSVHDIAEVMNRCLALRLSSSAVDRCIRRHGVPKGPPRPDAPAPAPRAFGETAFGFVHIDLKQLTRLEGRLGFVFVAIERTTRFVHLEVIDTKDRDTVTACLARFLDSFPGTVHTILTDNGSEFTDRYSNDMKGKRPDRPSGRHPFDRLCTARGIAHRLTRPYRPQTNGMAERFNRRLAEAIRHNAPLRAHRNRFASAEERKTFIIGFADAYNRTRLRCLDYETPLQKLDNQTGHNTGGRGQNPQADFG